MTLNVVSQVWKSGFTKNQVETFYMSHKFGNQALQRTKLKPSGIDRRENQNQLENVMKSDQITWNRADIELGIKADIAHHQ